MHRRAIVVFPASRRAFAPRVLAAAVVTFAASLAIANPFERAAEAPESGFSLRGLVREIPVANLPDVAISAWDAQGPVIYFDPVRAAAIGKDLAAFFEMHEYGHIVLDHAHREPVDANRFNRTWLRQLYEREADCFAASALAASNPAAISAALEFFEKEQGRRSTDAFHPSGVERARAIRAWLRDEAREGAPRFAHPLGDLAPCRHAMPWGPLHPLGDLAPCTHEVPR